MQKIQLQFGDSKLSFSLPTLAGLRQRQFGIIRDVIFRVGAWAVMVYLVGVNFLPTFYIRFESVSLYYGLLLIISLFAGFIVVNLLTRGKFAVDPPLFVTILFFALLSVLAYFLSPDNILNPAGTSTTFGVDYYRYLAAIGVILYVFSFYFITVYLRTKSQFVWATRLMLISMTLMPIVATIIWRANPAMLNSYQTSAITMLATMWIPTCLVIMLFRPMSKWGQLANILSLAFSTYLAFQSTDNISRIVVAIVLLGIVIVYVWNKSPELDGVGKYMRENVRGVLTGDVDWQDYLHRTRGVKLVAYTVIWIAAVALVAINTKFDLVSTVSSVVRDYLGSFRNFTDVKDWLVGIGSFNISRNSAVATVISVQGLMGLLAYLLLVVFSLIYVFKIVKQDLQHKVGGSIGLVMAPLLVGISLLALVTRLNITLAIWWWLAITLISVKSIAADKGKDIPLWMPDQVNTLIPGHPRWGRWGWRILQLILILVILVAALALVAILQRQVVSGAI